MARIHGLQAETATIALEVGILDQVLDRLDHLGVDGDRNSKSASPGLARPPQNTFATMYIVCSTFSTRGDQNERMGYLLQQCTLS